MPSSLGQLLGVRLARLSVDARDVLLIAALAGRPTVEVVAAAHGHGGRTIEAVDEAVRAGVVRVVDGRVRFTHPLFASVLHEQTPPGPRRDLHEALAMVVTDVEERARHRARATAGPDAAVAAELAGAAEGAVARGATAAGAELCELAAELTPADPALARRRRLRAAKLHRLAGDGDRALAFLEQLVAETPSGVERADVLSELATTFRVHPSATIKLLDQALFEASDDDARTVRLLANRGLAHVREGDVRASLADARLAMAMADRVGDPVLVAVAITGLGLAEAFTAEVTPALIERGVEIEVRLGLVLEAYESPRYALARLLMRQGEIDRPHALLEDLEVEAAARGDEGTRVTVLCRLGMLEWLAGRWSRALDLATDAHQLVEQTQVAYGHVWLGRFKALIEADLGLVEQGAGVGRDEPRVRPRSRGRARHHRLPRIVRTGRSRARQHAGGR